MTGMDALLEQLSIGSGRLVPTAVAIVGLIGVIIGSVSLARPRRAAAITALALGALSVLIGGLHVANSAGGVGTGNGLAGAVVAIALGVVAIALGCIALSRRRG